MTPNAIRLILLLAATLTLCSCFKTPVEKWPKPLEELTSDPLEAIPTPAPAAVTYGTEPTPTPAEQQQGSAAAAPVAAIETPPPTPLQLAKSYLATQDANKRDDLISAIVQADLPESTKALALLVPREMDIERKLTMLQALQNLHGEADDKLQAYSSSIVRGLPLIIRDAAMDGLQLLNDPKAIPVWQTLLTDPDPDLRERAKSNIQQLQTTH